MPASPIANDQVHTTEVQRFRPAQLIGPADASAPNNHFTLGQKPVGEARIFASPGGIDAGKKDASLSVPPDIQFGAVQDQLVKPEPQDRLYRQGDLNPGQLQCGAPERIEQLQVHHFDRRNQPA